MHVYDEDSAALRSPFVILSPPFPDSLSKLNHLPLYSLLLALHPVCMPVPLLCHQSYEKKRPCMWLLFGWSSEK